MVCVYCGQTSRVYNSRRQHRNNLVWRRRQCLNCSATYTSIEKPDLYSSWLVKGHTGTLKPFSEDRLYLSLYESLKHRPEAFIDARHITDTVIAKLYKLIDQGIVNQEHIKQAAIVAMNRFDQAASIHYQAFHE